MSAITQFSLRNLRSILLIAIFMWAAPLAVHAQEIRAQWQLESNQAVPGQGLTLTLQVQGTDKVEPPRFSIPGVSIAWLGGQPSNSTSIVSVNGKTTTEVRRGFVGRWTLKAQNPGRFHLDPVAWTVGGQNIRLDGLDWTVSAALPDDRFFLQQGLSQSATVPGVVIEYTLTWYLGDSARNPDFTFPILDNPDIEFVADGNIGSAGETFQIQYRNQTITGIKSSAELRGKTWTTLSFKLKVRPTRAIRLDLSGTTVAFEGAAGLRNVQDFFGDIRQEPYYKNLSSRANPLVLEVRTLPSEGKPNVFSGLIGSLALKWEGSRGPYQVGEPIRLSLKLSGVANKPDLDLDYMVITSLQGQDFTILSDQTQKSPVTEGSLMVRNYVLRAKKPGQLSIPPLLLNYFDPQSNSYRIARAPVFEFAVDGGAAFPAAENGNPDRILSSHRGGDIALNPPGLPGYSVLHVAWWMWSLPFACAAAVLSTAGWWRYSHIRALLRGRRELARVLRPLDQKLGRAALEEGRQRLQGLLNSGKVLRDRWTQQGHWLSIQHESRIWEEAFFDEGRDNEDWNGRWATFVAEAGGWN